MNRIIIESSDKKKALQAALRLRNTLQARGVKSVKGAFVRMDRKLYINFADSDQDAVNDVLKTLPEQPRVFLEKNVTASTATECLNCGNIPDKPYAVCPNCDFREISPCPSCGEDVPRSAYIPAGPNLYQCPRCKGLVRLAFNDPVWLEEGHYNEPVVIVTLASGVLSHV